MKKPMWMAVIAASVATIFLYGLSPDVAVHGIIKGATARATVETLVVFYSITFLQRMMEKRKNLSNAQVAMNGLFNNNRVNASIVPFLLGMLPAASTVLICGPIVRESVKDSDLSVPEQACITSYFRHISEAFVPTYTSIFIALGITEGRVSAGTFILAMLPMVAALFAVGWIFYLRRVPKDTGMVPDQPKGYYWKLLVQSIWAIALTIALILIFNIIGGIAGHGKQSPKAVVKAYVNAVEKQSGKKLYKLIDKKVLKYTKDEEDMDKDEMIDKLDQILEWSGESLENQVGKVKSIKVKFKKVKKLKGSKLEDKQEDYEDEYDIKVSQVARVEGTVKVKGKDDDIENDFTMYVYKRGGKWYLDFSSIY